eukprot:scaffold276_cov116-Isochrysis_galbana.AAC.8
MCALCVPPKRASPPPMPCCSRAGAWAARPPPWHCAFAAARAAARPSEFQLGLPARELRRRGSQPRPPRRNERRQLAWLPPYGAP